MTHGVTLDVNAVQVLAQSIQQGVSDCFVAESLVPVSNGELTRDDGGTKSGSIFNDLEGVRGLFQCQWANEEVVNNQDLNS